MRKYVRIYLGALALLALAVPLAAYAGSATSSTATALQQQIAEKFLAKLAKSKEVGPEKVAQLRSLLGAGKKLKADDLVKMFSLPAGGDLK